MKKTALILALLMAFSVVFVACGESGTESKDESAVSEAASKAANESKAESKEEPASQPEDQPSGEPSEQPSEEPSGDTPEVSVDPNGENLALGKEYTVSGCGHGLILTAEQSEWPCSYNANLTDGVTAEAVSYDTDVWFSISPNVEAGNAPGGVCEIVVDLGEAADIAGARFHICNPGESGIGTPSEVNVLVSNDNADFTKVASKTEADLPTSPDAYWVEFGFESTSARYVKFTFAVTAAHNFIDELAVVAG